VHLLEVGYLTLCFLASNSIALLNSSDELIAPAYDDLPIVVGQLTHFSWALPRNCFRFPFIWSVFSRRAKGLDQKPRQVSPRPNPEPRDRHEGHEFNDPLVVPIFRLRREAAGGCR